MTRLADINARIGNMQELRSVVGAMRSLAGMRVQEAHAGLPGIRGYGQSMAQAIGTALTLLDNGSQQTAAREGARALILFTAEHGFVGGFNERLLDTVGAEKKETDVLYILGSRGAVSADERKLLVAWTAPMATRVAGTPDMVTQLLAELYKAIARGEISSVEIIFSAYQQGGAPRITQRRLLPLDLRVLEQSHPRQPPLHNLPPRQLLESLMDEYIFALLTEAAAESIASENAARFAAMEAAHENVTDKLSELQRAAGEARQAEITEELLDIVTGTEALGNRRALHG